MNTSQLQTLQKRKLGKEKATTLLTAVKGTLVPMQFRFLEDDLEKLWKAKGILDARLIKSIATKIYSF